MPAMLAAPTLVMAVPLMLFTTALATYNALTLADFTKVSLTGFLVLETFAKFNKFHLYRIFVQRY
jgi:hypothetical protein